MKTTYRVHATEIAEVTRLHSTYPSTGMYLNNGSTTPLWTTNEWVDRGIPSPDGRKLVSFNHDSLFRMNVHEAGSAHHQMDFVQIMGYPSAYLYAASGKGLPDVEDRHINTKWDTVVVTYDGGATVSVRLSDCSIVRSDTLRHAFFQLFTTMQGITVFLVFVLITCGVSYVIARCFMGGSKGREARR